MPLTVITPASLSAPVDTFLAILKGRLDIPPEETFKDAELRDHIRDAIAMVENETWRTLFDTTYKLTVPGQVLIHLPRPPYDSITHVKYYDEDDTLTTLSGTTDYYYNLDLQPGFVSWRDGIILSFTDDEQLGLFPVEVTYKAGYGTAVSDLPVELKEAVVITAYAKYLYPSECTGLIPKAARQRCLHHIFRDDRVLEWM
jgi:uncharacterized phiE125 gp8 family phage protein